MKTEMTVTSKVMSKNFFGQTGKGLTMIHDVVTVGGQSASGPKTFQLKTSDLDEFVKFVTELRDSWNKAQQLETQQNT